MAASNVIVTRTTNEVSFKVNGQSYARAVKKIKQVGKEWDKVANKATSSKTDPGRAYDKSAQQMRLVNKRLAETRMREQKRATDHSIAMAKKEARAREAIARNSAARIQQQMRNMTTRSPALSDMKKFYQQQEREARRAARRTDPTPASPYRNFTNLQLPRREPIGSGPLRNAVYNPQLASRQNAEMLRHHRNTLPPRPPATPSREARRAAQDTARRDDMIAQQRIRLASRYGNNYGGRLGRNGAGDGIMDLNRQFRNGALSAGQYRQSIQALERQFRSAQNGAAGLGASLSSLRSTLGMAGAAYAAFNAGSSVIRQGQFFQGMDATMTMVSDSSEEAAKRIKFLKDQSYRLGLDLKIASQGYVQMSVNSEGILSKAQNNELFTGYSEYATALQVDPVKFQRGITAIGQMMGKGQVMAEELKGQLAEGIPGSLQVFVKAAREAFNDSSIDVEKLMDMMKRGELSAAKILPFVGKYFAEAARKGGALDKAMNSNRVAMQQMQQTWVNFQNAIFEGGFGEQMTRVFRDLATILDSNGDLATNLGAFFGSVIEGFWDMVTEIHDDFVLLNRLFEYYGEKLGIHGANLKEVFNWAGYAVGITLFVGGLTSLFRILTKISGLKGALASIRSSVTAVGAATAAGAAAATAGTGAPGAPGAPSSARTALGNVKGLGILGKLSLAGLAYTAGNEIYENFFERDADKNARLGITEAMQQQWEEEYGFRMHGAGLLDAWDEIYGLFNPPAELQKPTLNTSSLLPGSSSPAGIPFLPPQKIEGNVTIEIKAGELKNMIQAVVDENNQFNFNLLTQGGPN